MNYSIAADPRQTKYRGLDLMKLICSFLVIAIHVGPFYSVSRLVNFGVCQYLARIAVPFFFTCSGFLLFRKTSLNEFDMRPTADFTKKMLRLLGTWSVVLFVGYKWQLWYMSAVVVAVLIVSFLLMKKVPVRSVIILSVLLYMIGLLGDSYYGLLSYAKEIPLFDKIITVYERLFSLTRNGLFMGTIFVTIGMLFAYYPIKMSGKAAVGGFIVSMMLLFAETAILRYNNIARDFNMCAALVPETFFLFYIASHLQLKERKAYDDMRIMSALVFCLHMFVYWFVGRFFGYLIGHGGSGVFRNSVTIYGATLAGTLVLSYIICRLSKTKRFSWLKWLYS